MLVEEQKLRWCGIDMRPRGRRRVAVVLTYAAFLLAVWSPGWRAYGVVVSLMWISVIAQIFPVLKEVGSVVRAIAIAVSTLGIAAHVFRAWDDSFGPQMLRMARTHHNPEAIMAAGAFALLLLLTRSVVGWHKLVEGGGAGWMASAIRRGDAAWGWEKRRLARQGYAVGLEGFAWYEYMVKFRELTEEQKTEIEAMHRANPRGKWMRPWKGVLFDDERLRNEEAQLRARVQLVMNWVLVLLAVGCSIVLADGERVSANVVVSVLWTLAALATTLRQAIPVWSEPDPRTIAGEISVVSAAHA